MKLLPPWPRTCSSRPLPTALPPPPITLLTILQRENRLRCSRPRRLRGRRRSFNRNRREKRGATGRPPQRPTSREGDARRPRSPTGSTPRVGQAPSSNRRQHSMLRLVTRGPLSSSQEVELLLRIRTEARHRRRAPTAEVRSVGAGAAAQVVEAPATCSRCRPLA